MATNLQIKFIRSLQLKKNRDENRLFVCEGTKIVEELLSQNSYQILEIYAKKEWIGTHEAIEVPVILTSESDMQKISNLTTAPEVLAVVHYREHISIDPKATLSLYLDQISDPGNMGTIIRTADWYGCHQIFLSPQCVQIYNPKVVQATMGSLFRMNITTLTLDDLMKKNQFKAVYGAVLNGINIHETSFQPQSLLIMGSESHGIMEENIKHVTDKITIPRIGYAESLNVSVATGIILDHVANKIY